MVTSMLDARNDARNEGGAYQRVEVITGRQRRRIPPLAAALF